MLQFNLLIVRSLVSIVVPVEKYSFGIQPRLFICEFHNDRIIKGCKRQKWFTIPMVSVLVLFMFDTPRNLCFI